MCLEQPAEKMMKKINKFTNKLQTLQVWFSEIMCVSATVRVCVRVCVCVCTHVMLIIAEDLSCSGRAAGSSCTG